MLSLEFYQRFDVVQIAKDLIGTYLFTKIGDIITSGMIIETESYGGVTDRASHAFNDRRTKRTETMYQRGGIAYVYTYNGQSLHSDSLWIEKRKKPTPESLIEAGPRVGVEYAKEDALLPWRFCLRNENLFPCTW